MAVILSIMQLSLSSESTLHVHWQSLSGSLAKQMAVILSIMHVVHAGVACSREVCMRLPGGAGPSLPCDENLAGS